MALIPAIKAALQARHDLMKTEVTARAARGDGPGAAAAEQERQRQRVMTAIHWDTDLNP